ncbi:MAG: L-threonylcarbamoyladenylate synthase [Gemmatimonadota bacterium]
MARLVVDPRRPDPSALDRAAALLRAGQLVAFPTETVYGLGAHALDADAVRRIYEAKGRPPHNPVIVHVADADAARALVTRWPESAARLARAFWPGPLTLVLPKVAAVPDVATAGLPAVGVRVPAHPVALALLRAAGIPVAAPSANRFTELSPTSAAHVERTLGERVPLILDGGPASVGIESTVVDCTGPRPRVLRPGVIGLDELEAVAGPFDVARVSSSGQEPRLSPGMIDRHYAPRARVVLAGVDDAAATAATVAAARAAGTVVGIVAMTRAFPVAGDVAVLMPAEPRAYAARLYATLHDLDDEGCSVVIVERPPTTAAWAGVTDRLTRAATP